MPRYLIKLSPISTYFFGGETTLGGQDGKEANYFVKSNQWPQQTTLLGMLRYQILAIHNKLSPSSFIDVEDLIGKPFSPIGKKDYGKIKSISPVFLMDAQGIASMPGPLDDGIPLLPIEGAQSYRFGDSGFSKAHLSHDYNAKNHLESKLIDENGQLTGPLKDEKLSPPFIERWQVGITKAAFRKLKDPTFDAEKGFYRQQFWKLAQGYVFAFIVEIDEEKFNNLDTIVQLGGERSSFLMHSTRFEKDFDTQFKNFFELQKKVKDRIILTSDAYLPTLNGINYGLAHLIDFRYIETKVNTNKFEQMGTNGLNRSPQKYNLLQRGSVLKGDLEKIEKALEAEQSFRSIGYNHFIKV